MPLPVTKLCALALVLSVCGCATTPPGAAKRIRLPAGAVELGSPDDQEGRDDDEGPLTLVTVGAFRMDATPVTAAAFEARMVEVRARLGPAAGEGEGAPFFLEGEKPEGWPGQCNLGSSGGARREHPANCVTWRAAQAFCELHGGALPTEAEWEYATRAGGEGKSAFWWGDTFEPRRVVSSVGCGARGCAGGTAPVVRDGPRCNAWGLCDLAGHVWQWTATGYRERLDAHVTDGSATSGAPPERPVHRGGSWQNHVSSLFRVAKLGLNYPQHGLTGVGFRCVYR